jgi:drug/metabolite transporter (DMT)-like permease
MNWFYLALLAPLLFAITVLFDDSLLRFVYKSPYISTIMNGFFGILPLVAVFFRPVSIPLHLALMAMLSGFLTIIFIFFYFKSLALESPSVVIALFSLAPATIPILAHFFVQENLRAVQLLGFIIIVLASMSMAAVNIKQFKFSKALLPIGIAVVFMDAVALISKHVYQHAGFFSAYMYFCVGTGLSGLMFLLINLQDNKKNLASIKPMLKKVVPILITAELFNISAEFTLNLAISKGPVSLVKAIEGIQPIFMLFLALALYPVAPKFFREAEEGGIKKKFFLMAIAVAGLVLIGATA